VKSRKAERAELAPKLRTLVTRCTAPENGGTDGLTRWEFPSVCPLVSGLPGDEGEFILPRVSELARAAGVPLDGEHCNPNLYILVTASPAELLEGMKKRNHLFTFGPCTPLSAIISLIKSPYPVRVWYISNVKSPELGPTSGPINTVAESLPEGLSGDCVGAAASPRLGSKLLYGAIWNLTRVFVVVDETQLVGVSRGKMADYVALVGLAKLKPGARGSDAHTILKLFDGQPQAAPAAISEWDQALLRSLYATNEESKQQRGRWRARCWIPSFPRSPAHGGASPRISSCAPVRPQSTIASSTGTSARPRSVSE
jgi:hypothetical protein